MNNSKKNLWTLNFYFIDSQSYLHIMWIFLNHIKIETLDEIETSPENLRQQMIQLSEFFQNSFVLILKRKCLVRASRVRSGESGTPSTIIYTRWSSRRYELGCDTPVVINSLNVMTSYHQSSRNLEGTRSSFTFVWSLWKYLLIGDI